MDFLHVRGRAACAVEMERDEAIKSAYARGLQASADLAFKSLPTAQKFDNADSSPFEMDWRKSMLPLWKPQQTEQEAQDLAHAQLKEFMKVSPRRGSSSASPPPPRGSSRSRRTPRF